LATTLGSSECTFAGVTRLVAGSFFVGAFFVGAFFVCAVRAGLVLPREVVVRARELRVLVAMRPR
jgi:hypothetical protein